MSRKLVRMDNFSDVLAQCVGDMCGEVCQEAVDVLEDVSKEALSDVISTAPVSDSSRGTGGHHLRDAFQLDSLVYSGKGMAEYYNFGVPAKFVIHAPKWHKYSIIHLLEKGHTSAGFNVEKPFVPGKPFMVPAENRAKSKIIARLREKGLTDK